LISGQKPGKKGNMSLQALIEKARKPEPTGEQLKEQGMAKVKGHTPETYKLSFFRAAEEIALKGEPFTTEMVTRVVGCPPNGTHCNAVGAMMSSTAKQLGLAKIGYVKATRDAAHSRVIALWQLKK